MVLQSQWSIEERVCETDRAYARLMHLLKWLPQHAALLAIVEAVEKLEQRLQLLEGDGRGDEFRSFDGHGSVSNGTKYFDWLDLRTSRDELAVAFLITLQTRTTALREACCQVARTAKDEGMCSVRIPSSKPPGDLWALANYCKHRDEWPESGPLKDQQIKTFEALKGIPGHVAKGDAAGERVFVNELPTTACFAITGESTLALAMSRLIDKATTHYREHARQIDQAFALYEGRLAELRDQSAARHEDFVATAIRNGLM